MKVSIIAVLLLALPSLSSANDNYTYVYREPKAWSAIYKYCLACHEPSAIDGANMEPSKWADRVDACVLHMRSRGYPRPDKADVEALNDFLPRVTPANRKPPVYMYPPKRGSLAVP